MTTEDVSATQEAKTAIKQYQQTSDTQELSKEALESIGCTHHTRVTQGTHNNITHYLYRLNTGDWVHAKSSTNNMGEKYTYWYLCGIGTINTSLPDLDTTEIRNSLEQNPEWTKDIDQAIDAITTEINYIENWWEDSILNDGLCSLFTGDLLYLTNALESPEYHHHLYIEPNRDEYRALAQARQTAHPMLKSGQSYDDDPYSVHYLLDVTFDAEDLDVQALFN